MTKKEAHTLLRKHRKSLDKALESATSQFQVRICYVSAHEELCDLTGRIISELGATSEITS